MTNTIVKQDPILLAIMRRNKAAAAPSRAVINPKPPSGPVNFGIPAAPKSMVSVQSKLHGYVPSTPRGGLLTAIKDQSAKKPQYQSSVGHMLLNRRHISRGRSMPKDTRTDAPYAMRGTGLAVVPKRIRPDANEIRNSAIRKAIVGHEKDFERTLGYAGIANHELEHAHDQRVRLSGVEKAMYDIISKHRHAEIDAKLHRDMLKGFYSNIRVPKSLPHWEYTFNLEKRSEHERELLDAVKRMRAAKEEWRNNGYQVVADNTAIENARVEVGPSIGDLVFRAEQFKREEGKPLQHIVNLPGNKRHDINWMRDQALQHGYWDGRSMHDLIFGTPEGRQWYNQMVQGEQ